MAVDLHDVREIAMSLPRTEEHLIRDHVKFRVGRIVYASVSPDQEIMGFGYPREERAELLAAEPDTFLPPLPSDERYQWVRVRLAAIDETELRELLVDAWRMVVPKRVAREYGEREREGTCGVIGWDTVQGMPRTTTMNQVIHHAVRRDLARLESALGSAPDGDVTRARQLGRAYANLQLELTQHHEGEDAYIFPFLAGVDVPPELLKAMDDEHHAMAAALAQTRSAMAAYASSGSAADAQAARASVARTTAVVDQHLRHEEDELEPLLEPYLQTKEWKKTVEKKLRPPSFGAVGRYLAWIQDGITDEDRAYVRSRIPPPVTAVLGRVAGRAYHREIAPTWRG